MEGIVNRRTGRGKHPLRGISGFDFRDQLFRAASPVPRLRQAISSATMLTAIHRVHLKNGPWSSNGGYEYNAVLIAAVLVLAEVGPGDLVLIPPDAVHSIAALSPHAAIHCFCFAMGVKDAAPYDYSYDQSQE